MATTFDTMIRKSDSSMLIVCPNCATPYDIKTFALGVEGRSVRCIRCQTVWFAAARKVALKTADVPEAVVMAQTPPHSRREAETTGEDDFQSEASEPADMADLASETGPADGENQARFEDSGTADIITGAPPLVPGPVPSPVSSQEQGHERQFVPGEGPFPITGGDIEAFVRRKASKRAKQKRSFPKLPKLKWPLAPLPTLLLGLGATVTILIGWRADAVRLLPQTASLYSAIGLGVNLRGLVFENVKTSRETHDGISVMIVEGEIVSVSRKAVEIPRLRFGVRNGLGAEIYNWTAIPSRTSVPAGDKVPFRTRLASPPAETHDISVRFYNHRDTVAAR